MPHVNILIDWVSEDCAWRFCHYNSTICEIIARASSVPFWTKHLRKCVFVCVRMMEWWRVCIFKQLLVLVEMKRIGKAEGHRQPLPTHAQSHTHTHTPLTSHSRRNLVTWGAEQFRCSVGGCSAAAATWQQNIWRMCHRKTMSHHWDSVSFSNNTLHHWGMSCKGKENAQYGWL